MGKFWFVLIRVLQFLISEGCKLMRPVVFLIIILFSFTPFAECAMFSAGNLSTGRMFHTSTLLPNGKVLIVGGMNDVYFYKSLSSVEIYDIATNTWIAGPDVAHPRSKHTATLLTDGKVLVVGGAQDDLGTSSAEIYDPYTNSWSTAAALPFYTSDNTATLLPNGKVLVVGGRSAIYDPQQDSWLITPQMIAPRNGHTATLLHNGKVLVAGGNNMNSDVLSSSELYDPAINNWSSGGKLTAGRKFHTATSLPNGKVLVQGGILSHYENIRTAELYDTDTNTWSVVGTFDYGVRMATATLLPNGKVLVAGGIEDTMCTPTSSRGWLFDYLGNKFTSVDIGGYSMHTATLLPDGRVLFAGGGNTLASTVAWNNASLYDNYSGKWTLVDSMSSARQGHTTTSLATGEVLVTGGAGSGASLNSAEIFNEIEGRWRVTGSLASYRESHTATMLPSGKVLVAGGKNGTTYLTSAEVFDQSANSWSAAGALATARSNHSATLLSNGRVLVAGGISGRKFVGTTEVYNPVTNSWSTAGTLASARANHTATLLQSGKILVVGGNNGSTYLATAEIYDSASNKWSSAGSLTSARNGHSATLLANGKVLVAGGKNSTGYMTSIEIYDPASNTWATIGALGAARAYHSSTITFNGKVLVFGGVNNSGDVATMEIIDAASGTLVPWAGGNLAMPRHSHTAIVMNSGKILIVGGANNTNGSLASSELFIPDYFSEARRPQITSVSTVSGSAKLFVGGSGLVGNTECSSGSMGSSPSNFPLLFFQRIDNDQTLFLYSDPHTPWTDTSFTSQDLSSLSLPSGYYRATVLTNAVPSSAQMVRVAPGLITNSGSLDFGNTTVGTTAPVTAITVTNNGVSNVNLTGTLIYGADASQFVLPSGGTCGTSLVSGQSCLVNVTFSPTGTKEMNAMLRIKTNDINEAYDVPLHGTGVPITYTMTLAMDGTGSGTVAVTPAPTGVNCQSSCSQSFNSGTQVTLTPSAITGSIFTGWSSCDLISGADCQLLMNGNKNVTAAFVTANSDNIGSITVGDIAPTSAIISWVTDQPASSRVDFGQTTAYGSVITDSNLTTNHSLTLSGIKPGGTYHFKVTSVTAAGVLTSSADYSFTTPEFSVKTVGDIGNVAVIEIDGSYDAKLADGSINVAPRQAIAKEFIAHHGDTYDFLMIATTFPVNMPEAGAQGFYLGVKNDTQGIGLPLFDDSAKFGSQSKLQGSIDLGNISMVSANPMDASFEVIMATLSHEIMHRWGSYVRYKDSAGATSNALLGKDGGHWSYLLDSSGSFEYGNAWLDMGNGSYSSTGTRNVYSALDLYLMGLYAKTQVPPLLLIQNQTIDPAQLPQAAATVNGVAAQVSIDDIVAVEGERIPAVAAAQKEFKVGFVLLTTPGSSAGNEAAKLEILRSAWAGRFASLTDGRAKIADVVPSLSIKITSPANGASITGAATTVEGTVVNSSGAETGVVINGVAATISGNRFVVNNIPLQEGSNTIEASAADVGGQTAAAAATVTSVATGHIRLSANILSGLAPLEVALKIDGTFQITNCDIQRIGPAQVEVVQGANISEYTLKFPAEGIYTITATVNGLDGHVYQDSIRVAVLSKLMLERLLKQKWDGMKAKIAAKDVDGLVAFLPMPYQAEYRQAFSSIGDSLLLLNEYMTPIKLNKMIDGIATCGTQRFEEILGQQQLLDFDVYFVREKGVWKLSKF